MLSNVLNALFGCWHKNYSFPRTIKRSGRSVAASVTGTYVVCLDCGKELPYDWKSMKVVSAADEVASIAEPVESYVGK
ncbi:MAG: hypothetical protein WA463_14640 [Terriglobales bacterium]